MILSSKLEVCLNYIFIYVWSAGPAMLRCVFLNVLANALSLSRHFWQVSNGNTRN